MHCFFGLFVVLTSWTFAPLRADEYYANPIAAGADPWVVGDPHADRIVWCDVSGNRLDPAFVAQRFAALGGETHRCQFLSRTWNFPHKLDGTNVSFAPK